MNTLLSREEIGVCEAHYEETGEGVSFNGCVSVQMIEGVIRTAFAAHDLAAEVANLRGWVSAYEEAAARVIRAHDADEVTCHGGTCLVRALRKVLGTEKGVRRHMREI